MALHTTRRKTRLLGDMTNKLREPNNTSSTVYHEIRVDKDIPDDLGALGKLRLIYNGISANAWLTPVGIRHVKQSRAGYSQHSESISNELKNSIRDRAASANGIMGRRHFELDRQELGKGEMILGVKMGEKKGAETSLRIGTGVKLSRDGKERRKSRLHPGFERRIKTADPKSVKGELPDLTITQMVNVNNSSRSEPDKRDDLAPNNTPVEPKKRVKILDDEIGFKSIEAMHEAYKTRTKSAPLRNVEKEKDLVRSSTSMQECHPSYRGPTLKPLLGTESKDDANKPDCCNASCKGCFRACLASDDYFEKARFNEIQPRPSLVRVPRRQISYRLRPALRMAFLEQLAISKEPLSRGTKKDNHDNSSEENKS